MGTTSESSNTEASEAGSISEDVLNLGRALAAELDDTDTLGRWMAHHLSDLLERRQASTHPNADDAEIADIVLRLWAHRVSAPFRHQPYLRYTEILRAIDRMDRLGPGYPFQNPDDEDSPPENGDFARIAQDLVAVSAAAGALSSALLTELQLHAGNDEASWLSYASLLGGDEADEALRTLLNRMIARSASPDERRAGLLDRMKDPERATRAAKKTVEQVGLVKAESESAKPRPRKRRA